MGVIERLRRASKRIEDPVRGTAYVVAAGPYTGRARRATCSMELVIEADGVPPRTVAFKGPAARERWPHAGMVLAVTIDRGDPERFAIDWDGLPNSRDAARVRARQLDALLRAEASQASESSGERA